MATRNNVKNYLPWIAGGLALFALIIIPAIANNSNDRNVNLSRTTTEDRSDSESDSREEIRGFSEIFSGDSSDLENRRVEIDGLTVERVLSSRTVVVSDGGSQTALVYLADSEDMGTTRVGDTISLEGTIRAGDDADQLSLDESDLELFENEEIYIYADEIKISSSTNTNLRIDNDDDGDGRNRGSGNSGGDDSDPGEIDDDDDDEDDNGGSNSGPSGDSY